jgi:hypothetical protein
LTARSARASTKAFVEFGFALWVGVGAALYGAVGFARAIALGAPDSARFMSLLFLSGGIAMYLMYLIYRVRARKQPSADRHAKSDEQTGL